MGSVIVSAETSTCAPAVKLTELKFNSAPVVDTSPSHKAVVPSDLKMRNQPAVPVASAAESLVMAAAVITPPEAAPKAVAFICNSATNVPLAAVYGVAGFVPV